MNSSCLQCSFNSYHGYHGDRGSPQADVARVAVIVYHGSWRGFQNTPHLREDGDGTVHHPGPVASVAEDSDGWFDTHTNIWHTTYPDPNKS